MAYYTLLLLWVTVMMFRPLYAVPLRNHGGVSYGEDFLRILDPRARSPTTSTSTLSQSHRNRTSNSQDSELEQSGSVISFTSVTNSNQNSNSSKLRSSALRAIQAENVNNITRRKLSTTNSNNSSTTTPRTKRLQLSTPTNRVLDKHQVADEAFSTSRADGNYPYLYDDYDYYNYYMDDLHLPLKSTDELKNNSSQVKTSTDNSSTNISVPQKASDKGNASIIRTSAATPQSIEVTSNSEQSTSTTLNPTTSTTTVTVSPTASRKELLMESSTTSRPTMIQPQFRYQALKERTTTKLADDEIPEFSTPRTLTDHTVENKSKRVIIANESNREKNEITSVHSSARNASDNTLSQHTTLAPSLPEDTVSATTSTSIVTSRPSVPVLQDRHQRPKVQRNTPNRFRYTTPSPKQHRENRNISAAEDVKIENTLQKSLASSSSSSIVVEVRVESPQPEARRMPVTNTPPLLQILESDLVKGTPFPPRTVHTVNPDRHTTSFLLSDSLVVDLAPGPRTSNQQTERTIQQQRRTTPSSVQTRRSTTTPRSDTSVPLPQQQKEEQNPSESIRSINSKSDETRLSKILSETDAVESITVKTEQEINIKDNLGQNNTNSPIESIATAIQTQSQSVSTSVSRTVVHTAEEISNKIIPKPLADNSTSTLKPTSAATVLSNATSLSNGTLLSNTTIQPRMLSRILLPQGLHPQGLHPFGKAPGGQAPFGIAPGGLAPHGLHPTGLHPYGLSPYGYGANNSTNTTVVSKGTGLTLVDATVAEGGADANKSVGYLAVEHNISRFRHEEKTPDGFIVGEYGEVDHVTGDVNGVRYIAVDNADPNLIYDSLIKFLNL